MCNLTSPRPAALLVTIAVAVTPLLVLEGTSVLVLVLGPEVVANGGGVAVLLLDTDDAIVRVLAAIFGVVTTFGDALLLLEVVDGGIFGKLVLGIVATGGGGGGISS